jgi:hypothetical protein
MPPEKPAKRKCSPAQRAALRKGRAKMKASAKARRQALAAATKEAKAQGLTPSADLPPAISATQIRLHADDFLLDRALIGDGDIPSWLRD